MNDDENVRNGGKIINVENMKRDRQTSSVIHFQKNKLVKANLNNDDNFRNGGNVGNLRNVTKF